MCLLSRSADRQNQYRRIAGLAPIKSESSGSDSATGYCAIALASCCPAIRACHSTSSGTTTSSMPMPPRCPDDGTAPRTSEKSRARPPAKVSAASSRKRAVFGPGYDAFGTGQHGNRRKHADHALQRPPFDRPLRQCRSPRRDRRRCCRNSNDIHNERFHAAVFAALAPARAGPYPSARTTKEA